MKLALTILEFLRAGGDLLLPEVQLRRDVRLATAPAPMGSEISEALNEIEKQGWAVAVRDQVTQEIGWTITDAGRAQLAKRKL